MKNIFLKALVVAVLLVAGASTSAQAQLRLGINGVEFGPKGEVVETEQKRESVQFSAAAMVRTKPKKAFYIGRSSFSTIPNIEVGWNVLSNVGYGAPYAGSDVGDFLDLNHWKSTQVTVNLFHLSAYSQRHKVGANLGLGIRANNYRLDSSLSLTEVGGVVMPYALAGDVKKSKFNIASVHIPLELVFGTPRKFAFSVGGYVDMVMNSHAKVKYAGGHKDKEHTYPVNFIQAGATARLSFSWFSIFASYQPTQIFKDGCGPRAHQWTIGIGF